MSTLLDWIKLGPHLVRARRDKKFWICSAKHAHLAISDFSAFKVTFQIHPCLTLDQDPADTGPRFAKSAKHPTKVLLSGRTI